MTDVVRILEIMILMTTVPLWVGTLFLPLERKGSRLPFCWISGQILIWAGFQCICVPAMLTERTFREMERIFFCYVGILVLLAGVFAVLRRRRAKVQLGAKPAPRQEASRVCKALWGAFALLLILQLFLLCFLSYNEGDDAYYVAVATGTTRDGKMYAVYPYTGSASTLEMHARHALAPLPIWVAMLSMISGLSGAATAHVALPLILVPMTYCLYYLLGRKLVGRESTGGDWAMPLFMCFTALLVLFGGYSVYSTENFLLVRGAQGKSVLANVIIPFLIYGMLGVMERLERGEKTGILSWTLIGAVMIAGCLCSTLGSLLVCMLLGISFVCAGLVYRRVGVLIGAVFCMAAPVLFAYLYVSM